MPRTIFYTVTDPILVSEEAPLSSLLASIEDLKTSQPISEDRLINQVKNAANALYHSKKRLRVFTSLQAAEAWANENTIYQDIELDEESPWQQHAVVEIIVDLNSHEDLTPWVDNGAALPRSNDTLHRYQYNPLPTEHKCFELSNEPQNYMINRAWIKTVNNPISLHTEAPQTYHQRFRALGETLASVISLFQDYHSPAFFSFHWRHHKKHAEQISNHLKTLTPKAAYDFLFKERQRLMTLDTTLNTSGSFMRRLEFSLKKLRDDLGDQLWDTLLQDTVDLEIDQPGAGANLSEENASRSESRTLAQSPTPAASHMTAGRHIPIRRSARGRQGLNDIGSFDSSPREISASADQPGAELEFTPLSNSFTLNKR